MNYYIASVRVENWDKIASDKFKNIYFSSTYKLAKKMNTGDKIVIYIGSRISCFGALVEVIEHEDINYEAISSKFPIIISTKPKIILNSNDYIKVKEIKDNLTFIKKGTNNYGAYFQRGLKKINEQDYSYIYSLMKHT